MSASGLPDRVVPRFLGEDHSHQNGSTLNSNLPAIFTRGISDPRHSQAESAEALLMISALQLHHGPTVVSQMPHGSAPSSSHWCPLRIKRHPDYASIILGLLSVLVEFEAPSYRRMDPWVLFFRGLVRPERVGMG